MLKEEVKWREEGKGKGRGQHRVW